LKHKFLSIRNKRFANKKRAISSTGKILIIIENLPVPFDRRVWQEATSLKNEDYEVSVICPKGKGHEKKFEIIDDIYIYRHSLPVEARLAPAYFFEYLLALFWEFILSFKVLATRGFDVIHACNPPDLIVLIGLFYKIFFRKKFVFDHHDLFPEMWLSKGGKKNFIYKLLLLLENLTFRTSDISLATNNSYKEIALSRGRKMEKDVFIVRSSPNIESFKRFIPEKPNSTLKKGKKYMVGYVGVMAVQDGVDYLLRAADYIVNKKRRNDILFVLIGKGPEWKNLLNYAQELQLNNNVEFVGWKYGKELVDLLYACDIGVCPEQPDNEYNNNSTMNKILE